MVTSVTSNTVAAAPDVEGLSAPVASAVTTGRVPPRPAVCVKHVAQGERSALFQGVTPILSSPALMRRISVAIECCGVACAPRQAHRLNAPDRSPRQRAHPARPLRFAALADGEAP